MRIGTKVSSRRKFLTSAAAVGGALMTGPGWLRAEIETGADPRIARVLAETIGIDMHNHVYPAGTEPHPQHGLGTGPGQGVGSTGVALSLAGELKQSGLAAVCASFVLDFANNEKPGDARVNYLGWLSAIDAELAKGHLRRALTLADLQTAHRQRTPTIVQTVEGAMFLEGHLERLEEVYGRGLRHLQLLHEHDDMVAPLGDTNTGVAHLGGLTAFGTRVVKECNRLGIVVDLAHASHETVLGALKVSSQPVIVSHTSLASRPSANARMLEMMRPRLISKEHAQVVADAGGVVGVWTKMADSLAEFVGSVRAMVDAIGVDHVGFGTDTDLLSPRVGQGTNLAYAGMQGGFLPAVVGEMLQQGFTPGEIAKIAGGNFCRVFGAVTAGKA